MQTKSLHNPGAWMLLWPKDGWPDIILHLKRKHKEMGHFILEAGQVCHITYYVFRELISVINVEALMKKVLSTSHIRRSSCFALIVFLLYFYHALFAVEHRRHKADKRLGNPPPKVARCLQWSMTSWRTLGELGLSKSMERDTLSLQFFVTVGWVTGRASSLWRVGVGCWW